MVRYQICGVDHSDPPALAGLLGQLARLRSKHFGVLGEECFEFLERNGPNACVTPMGSDRSDYNTTLALATAARMWYGCAPHNRQQKAAFMEEVLLLSRRTILQSEATPAYPVPAWKRYMRPHSRLETGWVREEHTDTGNQRWVIAMLGNLVDVANLPNVKTWFDILFPADYGTVVEEGTIQPFFDMVSFQQVRHWIDCTLQSRADRVVCVLVPLRRAKLMATVMLGAGLKDVAWHNSSRFAGGRNVLPRGVYEAAGVKIPPGVAEACIACGCPISGAHHHCINPP